MNSIINYFSSSIDWCETNFVYNNFIAEFWNSFSSLAISGFGIVGAYNYPEIDTLYYSLVPIGITSFYFHASLSLLGQLLDEFSIIFTIILSLHYINSHVYKFFNTRLLYLVNISQVFLMFTWPDYNRLIFFIYGFYFWQFLRRVKLQLPPDNIYYINISEYLFALSVTCWVIDYFFCVKTINFHALWHVLIGVMAYYLFKAFYILSHFSNLIN